MRVKKILYKYWKSALNFNFFYFATFLYTGIIYILDPPLCSTNKSPKKTGRRLSVLSYRTMRLLLIVALTLNTHCPKVLGESERADVE